MEAESLIAEQQLHTTEVSGSQLLFLDQHRQNICFELNDSFEIIAANSCAEKFFNQKTNDLIGYFLLDLFEYFPKPLVIESSMFSSVNKFPIVGKLHMLSDETGILWHLLRNPEKNNGYFFIAQIYYNNNFGIVKQELIRERDQAKDANKVKLDFLANMSHELRNSLNGILGMAQILTMRPLPADTLEYVKDIFQSGNHLLSLVSDMLDFAKLEAGQLTIAHDPFNLRNLVSEVVEGFQLVCEKRNINLILDYCDSVPRMVIGDACRIRQILTNLINNAFKFTPSGHILIAVETLVLNDNNALLQIIVEDTGVGIPSDKITKIFDRFSQANNQDLAYTKEGIGLGLNIVKQLIEKMGGEIGINSQEGTGATFWINIPFKLQNTPHALDPSWEMHQKDIRCLIVDNNARHARVLLKQLNGSESTSCRHKEALSLLKQADDDEKPFHIAVLDDQIFSDDEGTFLLDTIQKDKQLNKTMICILTQNKNQGTYKKNKLMEITKPIDPSRFTKDLVQTWERWDAERKQQLEKMPSKAHQQHRLLLVEDNLMNQKVATIMFQELGCDITIAGNAKEAMENINKPYDIIFLDIGLPDLDGCKLAEKIISEPNENNTTPIVALTAHALESERDKFIETGMKDVLIKPITFANAEKALGKWALTEKT